MANSQEVFKNFYMSKHNGRRLMWQNNLGHCVVKATFPKGKKELLVSLFQTVVLLLFNDRKRDRLTYNEIKELTNIGEAHRCTPFRGFVTQKVN
jgi:cullin-4